MNAHSSPEHLHQKACSAREHAYAPYSRYQVGAALTVRGDEEVFTGCNVENASYGATLCAERTAVVSAVAARGPDLVIDRLVLVTGSPACPCGMCLQVLSEFSDADTRIHCGSPSGPGPEHPLTDFLPQPFDADNLEHPE